MIALTVILVILILLLSLKVGVDVSYIGGVLSLAVKAGPAKINILPKKEKSKGEKKEKKKKSQKAEGEISEEKPQKEKKKSAKLTFDDILGIVKLVLKAIGRFFKGLRMDHLMLHLTTADPDPYSAVMNYGYFNAAIGAVLPLLHRVFKVKKEDISSRVDFEADKLKFDAGLALTIRIGQILFIALCAAFAFLKWLLRRRRRIKAEEKAAIKAAKATENTEPEKGQ